MNKIKLFFTFVTCFFLISCQMSQKKRIEKIIQEWQGKEIIIPATIKFKTLGQDTLCSDLWNKPYKIFTYVDSIGCASCQLGVLEWKGIIQLCHQQQMDVGFIFVVHASNFNRFEADIRIQGFDYPIIYDYHNEFDKLNHFPADPYRTFLLDKDNNIQLIGSPVNNPQMWELYIKIITQLSLP